MEKRLGYARMIVEGLFGVEKRLSWELGERRSRVGRKKLRGNE